jgi:phosphatidylserine/phosphatidylglycerophosphate/cardiolipin synthase-like enzyme
MAKAGIEVTFLEQDCQKPADIAGLLAEFLAGARASLHLAIYDCRLSDGLAQPVVRALRERAVAGVEVLVAYDAGKRAVSFPHAGADPAPPGTADFFRRIGNSIQAKPITGGDPRLPKLMHHKYIIRDGRTAQGTVWTGSTNFTDDSWTIQENNILRIASPELCAYFETDFAELWTRGDISTTGAHDTGAVSVNGTTVGVAFAPGEGRSIDHDVAHRIALARRRLKICSMLLTSGAILGALGDALQQGRLADYSGLYDRTQMESVFDQWQGTPAEWKSAAFKQVAGSLAGKRSTPYTPAGRHDFMHNKVLVADDTVITGSYNFSNSASENAENLLVIKDHDLAERYCGYIDGLIRRYGEMEVGASPKEKE